MELPKERSHLRVQSAVYRETQHFIWCRTQYNSLSILSFEKKGVQEKRERRKEGRITSPPSPLLCMPFNSEKKRTKQQTLLEQIS